MKRRAPPWTGSKYFWIRTIRVWMCIACSLSPAGYSPKIFVKFGTSGPAANGLDAGAAKP